MSTQFDPLKATAQELHRFWFTIRTLDQWYAIMRECRAWFGREWRAQGKVRRKLHPRYFSNPLQSGLEVWFEVPDPKFATWISVKLSLQVQSDEKKRSNK